MTEEQYSKREARLLRLIEKSDAWYNRIPVVYLLPLLFVISQSWMLYHLHASAGLCIAFRLGDELRTVDISPGLVMRSVILPISFLLLIGAWLVDSSWRERRMFKEMLKRKKNEES